MMIERKWLVGMQKLSAVVFYCFFVTKLTIRQKREFIQAVVIQQFTRSTLVPNKRTCIFPNVWSNQRESFHSHIEHSN